ncbi:PREDICTED: CDK2-associated and cullin domain-containing protein 1 isoform X2 [Gekko japonicus]|uniref:CDK2-associated and cullin domain-containing protein 1 isoform X2 n=1 Tax=Gekko japonicus TaxID=146911 RepID=A0ABM1K262_GEKJA|nr:PREDICTED: CDK2-associated and cullin domain-containing protein 1 isoform X2 [Gekko japonicus]
MEEESMEEEGGGGGGGSISSSSSSYEALMDDQNHNNWEAAEAAGGGGRRGSYGHQPLPPPPLSPVEARGECAHRGSLDPQEDFDMQMLAEAAHGQRKGCAPAPGKGEAAVGINLNISSSASKFLMNVITIEDYKSTYWPKLDSAIDQLLTQSPGDYIPISYEQIYSCVYKCVCQQHSEQMYSDLIKKITNHLERVSKELQASPPELYVERFNIALGQYMGALQSIVPLFIYMNKFYIETKLNRDLRNDLIKLFTEHVAEKHIYSLMPLLLEAQSTPFWISPSTMANIVKGLYMLRPEWVQMAPALFSKFIPNILPPAVESELGEYAAQDQKLQQELIQEGFSRGDQSRKRPGEELTYNGSASCASSRGCR